MKRTTKDNLIYLGVAGTIVAALTFYIFYADRTLGRIPSIPGPILWGIIATPGIIALLFEQFWEYRSQRWLWVISFVAGLINVSVTLVAYRFGWEPPAIVWSTMTVLWLIAAILVANKFAARKRNSR